MLIHKSNWQSIQTKILGKHTIQVSGMHIRVIYNFLIICTSLEYIHYIKVSCEFLDVPLYFANIKIMSS